MFSFSKPGGESLSVFLLFCFLFYFGNPHPHMITFHVLCIIIFSFSLVFYFLHPCVFNIPNVLFCCLSVHTFSPVFLSPSFACFLSTHLSHQPALFSLSSSLSSSKLSSCFSSSFPSHVSPPTSTPPPHQLVCVRVHLI